MMIPFLGRGDAARVTAELREPVYAKAAEGESAVGGRSALP